MAPRRVYQPQGAPAWTPTREWVELVDGSWICVWELSVPEQFQVAEASLRHPSDPRPGANEKEASLWLLAYACRKGDGTPDAPDTGRVFGDLEVRHLLEMHPENFGRLLQAARGLVQPSPETEEKERNFTGTEDSTSPNAATGASSTSTASRKNSPASAPVNSTGR